MSLQSREEAEQKLEEFVANDYQRRHAKMVATAMEGYARLWGLPAAPSAQAGDGLRLYYITGLLHDLDYEQFPDQHPGPSLQWFSEWGYPQELIHAVEAHALGFNGFTIEPRTKLAETLLACDEICGIFFAYQKLNPIPYGEMKASSIKKRFKDKGFAPGISREHIYDSVERLGISIDEHVENLIGFLGKLEHE